jgi:hypothetical protein
MSAVIDHLTQVPLFRGMTQSALEAVAGLAAETQFVDGDEVTREGTRATPSTWSSTASSSSRRTA